MTSYEKTMTVSGTQGMMIQLDMYVSNCPSCGVIFGITMDLQKARRADKGTLYCPNGHQMSWQESEADKLKKAKTELERRLANEKEWNEQQGKWLRDEREAHKKTERSLSATKGVLTKTRKRVAAGVCPCCNRTFQQLSRHMSGQHPDYVADATAG